MIRLLTDDRTGDFLDFCRDKIPGAVLSTRLLTYGTRDRSVLFWTAENNGGITGALGLLDGVMTVCADASCDSDEVSEFARISGAKEISRCDAEYIMKFGANEKTYEADDITGENLKDIFPVIFEENALREKFFPQWYADASHKLRHGLIHGKCVYSDGKCVSAALTSGETDKIAVISSVATMKEYRKQGFGERVVISLAKSLSKEAFLLTNSEKSFLWYEKIGFNKL